jgi:hypothetical protein
VDHCIVSAGLTTSVADCRVLEDSVMNTSDHLAITVTLQILGDIKAQPELQHSKIAWHKLSDKDICEKYTKPLEQSINGEYQELLNNPNDLILSPEDTDKLAAKLVEYMILCSDSLNMLRKQGHTKPYWNDTLTAHSKKTKAAWHEWSNAGRPRGANTLFVEYKQANQQFRQERKRVEVAYEQRKIQELCSKQEIDQSYFWFLVNRHKTKSKTKVHPLRVSKTKTLTDPSDIR